MAVSMATMTIRNIDDQLKARLRVQAALHGRSMEDEARDILRAALSAEPVQGASLADAIRARVALLGGVALDLPAREAIRTPPALEGPWSVNARQRITLST
jgi:antitoxin FitA